MQVIVYRTRRQLAEAKGVLVRGTRSDETGKQPTGHAAARVQHRQAARSNPDGGPSPKLLHRRLHQQQYSPPRAATADIITGVKYNRKLSEAAADEDRMLNDSIDPDNLSVSKANSGCTVNPQISTSKHPADMDEIMSIMEALRETRKDLAGRLNHNISSNSTGGHHPATQCISATAASHSEPLNRPSGDKWFEGVAHHDAQDDQQQHQQQLEHLHQHSFSQQHCQQQLPLQEDDSLQPAQDKHLHPYDQFSQQQQQQQQLASAAPSNTNSKLQQQAHPGSPEEEHPHHSWKGDCNRPKSPGV